MVYEGNATLGDMFTSSREKGSSGLPTLSVTLHEGLVSRKDLGRKTVTNLSSEEHLLVKEGYIAYNMMRMWQGASGIATQEGVVSPAYIVLVPKVNTDGLYASYLFKTSRMIYLFWAYSYGLTKDRLRLYFNDFKKIPVTILSKVEQKKIAQILSIWDKAIATTEKLIANSQQQKKALMQQLLTGKKRFPGFEGEWRKEYLKDVANIVMGSSPRSEAYNESKDGLPLIQGNADIKNRKSLPRIYTKQITKECNPRDILLSVRAPVGAIALSKHHACIGRGISAIKAKEGTEQEFLYQWLLAFEPKWGRLSQGSTFEAVNSDDIKSLQMIIPSFGEQKEIALVLSNADDEVDTLQKDLEILKQEKSALMQQLLTGKRRVKIQNV